MANYEKQWSLATPGLLIILIDQSASMQISYEGENKAIFVSRAINRMIDEILIDNYTGERVKNRIFISVIGYNHNVKELCFGWLSDLDEHPIRIENVKQKVFDGAGGIVSIDRKMPIWIDSVAEDEDADLKSALERAKELCEKWMHDKPNNPAPVIVNISGSIPSYKGKDARTYMNETEQTAKEIINMSNDDGNVLLFNVNMSDKNIYTHEFPTKEEIEKSDNVARFFYKISSVIPNLGKVQAEHNGFIIPLNAKGYTTNPREMINSWVWCGSCDPDEPGIVDECK